MLSIGKFYYHAYIMYLLCTAVDETTTDIICIKCKKDDSDSPNEIVLCDLCGIGNNYSWIGCNIIILVFIGPNHILPCVCTSEH